MVQRSRQDSVLRRISKRKHKRFRGYSGNLN